jgi:hypothetical protein
MFAISLNCEAEKNVNANLVEKRGTLPGSFSLSHDPISTERRGV